MINYHIKPINAIYENNIYKINYVPFAISTIKLLIYNLEDNNVKFLIKPIRTQNDYDFCGGFDDENKGLQVIWGGGQEEGISTLVKSNDKKYAFFFVFPTQDFRLSNYKITLRIEALKPNSNDSQINEIQMNLEPVKKYKDIQNIAHSKIKSFSHENIISFSGNLLHSYYPRWYPEFQDYIQSLNMEDGLEYNVSYFSLKTSKKTNLLDKDRIMLYFKEKKIVDIEGDMDGAMFQADLFSFNNFIIIRIWFLWTSKKQFHEGIVLEPLDNTVLEKSMIDFKPELPDMERFDIMVSPYDGKILFSCTDFHWQEFWYRMRDDLPMKGIIAKMYHPFNESLLRLLNRDCVKNKYKNIMNELKNSTSSNSKSKEKLIYTMGEEIDMFIKTEKYMYPTKSTNFFRSHVPYVRNADILSHMISSIVDKEEK